MNILLIGNGGREHAICWKIAQSSHVKQIWVANGNAGTALEPKTQNIAISPTDIPALLDFARNKPIDLTIVGPEAPLALGISDRFKEAGLACFGPSQAAAQLESSKIFCKNFMQKYGIPTAHFATFNDVDKAVAYLEKQSFPIVIKADGLAAGKGVIIAENLIDAKKAVESLLKNSQFGEAGSRIVIEEFLVGEELSFICLVDGQNMVPLASSQDHKRRDDGDQGPNTGGMGAYSPSPLLTDSLSQIIMQKIMYPTIRALQELQTPYIGFLYAGLMITPDGQPKLLEFNCRLGDPETQPILIRLKSDLIELCLAALNQKLDKITIDWDPRPALGIVLASAGYPDTYHKGYEIKGLQNTINPNCKVFHAGTTVSDHKIVTNGGRVLTVTALGNNLQEARDAAYQCAKPITWTGCFYRNDIGYRAL